jgi:signal transduction histidine kinase
MAASSAYHGHVPPNRLKRIALAYRWTLFDVILAAGLIFLTAESLAGAEDPSLWWFALPMAATLLIRRRFPKSAVIIAGAAALLHHLDPYVSIQPIDLAVPLTVYTLASTGRQSRRVTLAGLAIALVTISLVSVAQVIALHHDHAWPARDEAVGKTPMTPAQLDEATRLKAQAAGQAVLDEELTPDVPVKGPLVDPPPTPSELARDAVARALSSLLVIALAFAIGDGVRSRRAHLTTLEKRADDLEREQRQRVALSLAAERARITRELHDVVAHALSVMVVQAQGAAAALRRHPDRTEVALQNVITTGRTSLAEMRRLLDLVRQDPSGDPRHAPQPGVDALPELVDGVRAAGTPVTFTIDSDPVPLPLTVDLSAYRIIQEALTNTIKHAGGTGVSAQVRIAYLPDGLELEVTDNGTGPSMEAKEGNGLRGIAERVAVLDGHLSVGPLDNRGGFRVHATLPLCAKGFE